MASTYFSCNNQHGMAYSSRNNQHGNNQHLMKETTWEGLHLMKQLAWDGPHLMEQHVLTSCNKIGWPTPHETTCDVLTSCKNIGWPACDNQHGKVYTSRTINKGWTSFRPRPYSVSNQQNAPHERNNLRRIIAGTPRDTPSSYTP